VKVGEYDANGYDFWNCSNNGNSVWFRPDDGDTDIRIIPTPDGLPFAERWFYYNIGSNPGLLAPYQFGDPDPIQELITKLRDEGTKESYELAKKLYPTMRYYAPVVVRGEEDKGVRLWSFGKTVYQSLLNIMLDEDYGDITDPTDGRDIKVVCTKAPGRQWATTEVRPRGKVSKLGTAANAKQWLESVPTLDDMYDEKSYDALSKIVNDWLNGDEESTSNEGGTTRGFNGTPPPHRRRGGLHHLEEQSVPGLGSRGRAGGQLNLGENKLYVIAGERNMKAVKDLGGLYANVGQTTRTVYDRIKDKDYRLKSGAGTWKVIIEDTPLGKFEDAHIHELLRKRNDVKWDPQSSNTEEFHFITDKGDGEEVKRIIKECLNNLQPHLIEKDIDIVKSKLETAGIRHASEFNGEGIYWFRIQSFVDRVDANGKTYLIINFINSTGAYKSIFCWTWRGEYPKIGSTFIAQVKKGKRSLATSYFKLRPIQNDLPAEVLEEVPDISSIGFFCNYDELIAYHEKEYKIKLDRHESACVQSYQEKLIKEVAIKDKYWNNSWQNHYKHEIRKADQRTRQLQEAFTRSKVHFKKSRNIAIFAIMVIFVVAMFFGLYSSGHEINKEHEDVIEVSKTHRTAAEQEDFRNRGRFKSAGKTGSSTIARAVYDEYPEVLAFVNSRRVVIGLKPLDKFNRQVQLDKTKYKLEIEIRDRHSDPKLALREYNENR